MSLAAPLTAPVDSFHLKMRRRPLSSYFLLSLQKVGTPSQQRSPQVTKRPSLLSIDAPGSSLVLRSEGLALRFPPPVLMSTPFISPLLDAQQLTATRVPLQASHPLQPNRPILNTGLLIYPMKCKKTPLKLSKNFNKYLKSLN